MQQKVRKKRKLGSYPFLSVTFSITLALIVIGLFGLLAVHANKLTNLIKENIEVQVFLNKNISSTELSKVNLTLGSKPYVLKKEGSPSIDLVTKEVAAKQFMEDTGEDFTEFLGDNPLRDLYVLRVGPGYHSADSLAKIKKELQTVRGVYEVTYVESLVESINKNLTKLGALLGGFALILVVVVVVLINNTIKLALFSQRFLIRSMQLVGATSSFIRRPFLIRSLGYGFIGGLFSSGLLMGILYYANKRIEDLDQLQDTESLIFVFVGLIFMGMIVTYLSTFGAMKKYLKMSLDQLY
ncbi:MAG: permease-like cell division protein FtsX [Cyclobacteriaceae bacterium]